MILFIKPPLTPDYTGHKCLTCFKKLKLNKQIKSASIKDMLSTNLSHFQNPWVFYTPHNTIFRPLTNIWLYMGFTLIYTRSK